MKAEFFLIMIFVVALAHADQRHLGLGRILKVVKKHPRIMDNLYNCLMEKGICDGVGDIIKGTLPRILETKCADCTPELKRDIREIVKYMQEKEPEKWKNLMAKYDPSGNMSKNILTDPEFLGRV